MIGRLVTFIQFSRLIRTDCSGNNDCSTIRKYTRSTVNRSTTQIRGPCKGPNDTHLNSLTSNIVTRESTYRIYVSITVGDNVYKISFVKEMVSMCCVNRPAFNG